MELWLRRNQEATNLEYDEKLNIADLSSWRTAIDDPSIISSILWTSPPVFVPLSTNSLKLSHPHEKMPQNDLVTNMIFKEACKRVAERLNVPLSRTDRPSLVYAPLRGALPIWKAISSRYPNWNVRVYHPVTSSFVFYPERYGIKSRKGKNASGRHTNILELKRIRPLLKDFEYLIYVDEIVSGGMMWGHVSEMLSLGVHKDIKIIVAGVADDFGHRATSRLSNLNQLRKDGLIHSLDWEGCRTLSSEDNKLVLGVHYIDYHLGPHIVPILTESGIISDSQAQFEKDVLWPKLSDKERVSDPSLLPPLPPREKRGSLNNLERWRITGNCDAYRPPNVLVPRPLSI